MIDTRIVRFIRTHHVLTLATFKENEPWCANCFYAYSSRDNTLLFTSELETKHAQEIKSNPNVAGSIVLETKIIGKIQGIQFTGIARELTGDEYNAAKKKYLKRFPFAVLMKTPLWEIRLKSIKMTDNRLGFGKKLLWEERT